ncbi:MAG: sigma 54-interacting transcriptional regulator, partial [Deltaproteobacteria bacterium]|nr:sigma 54-interacting transcriptional regulator [Deltaproteobacteria bacterium]
KIFIRIKKTMTQDTATSIPKIIDDQFRVEKMLGEGTFARVFKVRRGKEIWALKLLKKPLSGQNGEAWIEAFRFEFSLLKDIIHPAVVKIGDFGWDKQLESIYFTEELVEGTPLDEFTKECDPQVGEALFIQCLEALDAIHRAGAVHGDVKPSNIYVVEGAGGSRDPQIKILDLGIAHPKFQLIAGTPSYFAPEKVLNESVDERSDLYSLGVTFYYCLTGSNPFVRASPTETLRAQVSVIPPAPGSINPKISPYLNRILCRLLAKNPRDRFVNAKEVLTELDFEKGVPKATSGVATGGVATSGVAAAPPVLISEKWVGRAKAVEGIRKWVDSGKGGLLLIAGEAGIGKSRLLNEMRYELELKGFPVRTDCSSVDARMPAEMVFLIDMNRFDPAGLQPLIGKSWKGIVALLPDEAEKASQWGAEYSLPVETVTLEPMTRDDVRRLIALSTRDENPPALLVDPLYAETKGHPGTTVSLLLALCRAGKLVGPHGEWNLALFREGLDYATLEMTPSERDQLLSHLGRDKPLEKAELLIEACDEKLKLGRFDEAALFFDEVEDLIKILPRGEDRLKLRIALLEKRGWKSIREENFDAAKRELEVALGLLEELEDSPEGGFSSVISLRVRNYYAFVLMHEGKAVRAVEIFRKTEEEWEKLPSDEDRRKVTNNDLALALMQQGECAQAANFLEGRLPFYEELADSALKNRCHYNLGECFLKLGDHQRAIEHYQASVQGARPARQWDLLLRAYNGLGNAYNLLKDVDATLANYQRALDLARYLKDWAAASAVAQNMGVIQQELGQTARAEKNITLSLQMLKQVTEMTPHIRYLKARATLELGEVERQQRQFDKARTLFGQASQLVMNEKGLEDFVFWVMHSQALLALDEDRPQEFSRLYPELLHHAVGDEQKKRVEFLKKRSPVDPTLPQFQGSGEVRSEWKSDRGGIVRRESSGPLQMPPLPPKIPHVRPDNDPFLAVLQINTLLGTERDLQALLSLVLQCALNLSKAESGLILLADERRELSVAASRNMEVDDDLSQVSRQVAGKVLETGKAVCSDNALNDPEFKNYRSVMLMGLKSIFCLPVRSGGKVIGVLYLTHRFQTSLFNAETMEVMQVFADQAGMALSHAQLLAQIEEQNRKLENRLAVADEQIETFQTLLREKSLEKRHPYAEIISKSPAMERVFGLLDRVTATNLSVLIHGESGTGKELVARALHKNGSRADGPFVAINCGALPANLIESELFGYKAGAYTGAVRDKPGLFEMAKGGVLFLDEIGELDVTLQVKLLRAVQEREIMRLGDTRLIPIDVRIVSASLKNLKEELARKKFREDLYYRIAEIQIDLPPLRERCEDIPLLIHHFVEQFAREQGLKKNPAVAKDLLRLLVEHRWPGNVRELANRVRVACALSDGKVVRIADLPEADRLLLVAGEGKKTIVPPGGSQRVDRKKFFGDLLRGKKKWKEIENIIMAKALLKSGFDVVVAARALGVAQATLYNRLRRERFRARKSEFEVLPFILSEGIPLEILKREVFCLAYELNEERPYHAARSLGVSPGMFYQWVEKKV